MRLQDIIIGLMVFAAVGLSIFTFAATLYSVDNLNVTMDSRTQANFDKLNENLKTTQSETSQVSETLQSYAPGGANQTLQSDTLSASDLAVAGWKAVMQVPSVLGIFSGMVITIGNVMGINATLIGFIIGALLISVILTIIGLTFYREVM